MKSFKLSYFIVLLLLLKSSRSMDLIDFPKLAENVNNIVSAFDEKEMNYLISINDNIQGDNADLEDPSETELLITSKKSKRIRCKICNQNFTSNYNFQKHRDYGLKHVKNRSDKGLPINTRTRNQAIITQLRKFSNLNVSPNQKRAYRIAIGFLKNPNIDPQSLLTSILDSNNVHDDPHEFS